MTVIPEPFAIVNGQTADGDQLEADLAIIRTISNGQLEAGINIQAASTGAALTGNSASGGSSGFVSRGDHQHVVRGFEQFASDPVSGNFVGRHYYDTTNNRVRMCIATPGTWVTSGNLAATDLPVHASRHAVGGPDPLSSNSVSETMFAARTIFQGLPTGDTTLTSDNNWAAVVTGLNVTITTSQVAWLIVHAAFNNGGTAKPTVAVRVADASNNVLWMSPAVRMGNSTGDTDNVHISGVYPVLLSASPVLKLQATTSAHDASNGPIVRQQTTKSSTTFNTTSLSVVVG
jgi:hypothetical protein